MKAKNNIWNKFLWFFVILIIIVSILQYFEVGYIFEQETKDMIYQEEQIVSPDIFIIGIDEDTLDEYGYFEAWSREKITEIINVLCEDEEKKPAVIALDIFFDGESDKEIDSELSDAIKNAGNVVIGCSAITYSLDDSTQVSSINLPYEGVLNSAYDYGLTNAIIDSDGVIRYYIGNLRFNGVTYDSFAVSIAKAYMESQGESYNFDKYNDSFYINYTGKNNAYYGSTTIGASFSKVISGEYPVSAFKDAIVLIGTYSYGMQDEYYTSISKRERMFGVEIQANVVNQILDGVYKKELSHMFSILFTIVIGLIAIIILRFFNSRLSIVINIVVTFIYTFIAKLLYSRFDIILPILYPILVIFIITFVGILYSHLKSDNERKKMIDVYGKYLSPELALKLADDHDKGLILGGKRKNVAVLFVDIRGFTSLSESNEPEDVVALLNKYFKVTTTSIIDEGGTIDKFIGDCTMGLFNALVDLDDYVYRAVCAGLNMIERSIEFEKELPEHLKGKCKFGVGVHYGDAIIGNIGTDFRMEFTAIGDTVNTASRIEGKSGGSELLISKDVYDAVKDRFDILDAGEIELKGKAKAMHVYKVLGRK